MIEADTELTGCGWIRWFGGRCFALSNHCRSPGAAKHRQVQLVPTIFIRKKMVPPMFITLTGLDWRLDQIICMME